jgi:oligopeptide/dipeptide ABC transporter ATP-binding protein
MDRPQGCSFHPRCPLAMDRCAAEAPAMREVRPGHFVACHLYESAAPELAMQTAIGG